MNDDDGRRMGGKIFSLGHSNLSFERFIELLRRAEATAVADVRSAPFSKHTPWFSQREFKVGLHKHNFAYAFLGDELGGRPRAPHLFRGGVADYTEMANTDTFKSGINRLVQGSKKHQIVMVCAERDPLHCHRCLLVARQLFCCGVVTWHIHADGSRETQQEAEERLLREEGLAADDLLRPRSDRIVEAYRRRSRQVAYSLNPPTLAENQ